MRVGGCEKLGSARSLGSSEISRVTTFGSSRGLSQEVPHV